LINRWRQLANCTECANSVARAAGKLLQFLNVSSYESNDDEGADSLSTPSSASRVGSTRVSSSESESDSDNEICDEATNRGRHKKDFKPKREQHLGHSGLNALWPWSSFKTQRSAGFCGQHPQETANLAVKAFTIIAKEYFGGWKTLHRSKRSLRNEYIESEKETQGNCSAAQILLVTITSKLVNLHHEVTCFKPYRWFFRIVMESRKIKFHLQNNDFKKIISLFLIHQTLYIYDALPPYMKKGCPIDTTYSHPKFCSQLSCASEEMFQLSSWNGATVNTICYNKKINKIKRIDAEIEERDKTNITSLVLRKITSEPVESPRSESVLTVGMYDGSLYTNYHLPKVYFESIAASINEKQNNITVTHVPSDVRALSGLFPLKTQFTSRYIGHPRRIPGRFVGLQTRVRNNGSFKKGKKEGGGGWRKEGTSKA
ncbi:hypothetical protein C0J52_24499, partial [Blattella germanica]